LLKAKYCPWAAPLASMGSKEWCHLANHIMTFYFVNPGLSCRQEAHKKTM